MMEFKKIYDDIIENYLNIKVKSNLELYKIGIKELRNSYKENICKPLYQSKNNRDCYMLAYFPYYCLLTSEVIYHIKDNIKSTDLVVSIYGCGPAPEVIGVYEQFKDRNIKFNLFDYEYGWEEQRKFVKEYVKSNFNNNIRFNEISGCDLLTTCIDCEALTSKCSKFIKNTDIFIMQNCLNHITNKEDFKEKVSFIMNNAKNNSVFIFADLNYNISKSLMNDILSKSSFKILAVNKNDSIRINKNDIPKYIKEYIFTGEEGLILKTNINYEYMIIKKDKSLEREKYNQIEDRVELKEKSGEEKKMETLEIQSMSIKANELRKLQKYEEALELYESIEAKDENTISGMANCYRKLGKANTAIKVINRYIKENPKFNIDESKWFKIELVWAYRDYYLTENYLNKENTIKAVNKIIEYGEKDNEYLLKSIKKAILTKEVIAKYPNELKKILEKIDGSDNNYLNIVSKIKVHIATGNNINTCIYYNIILNKMKVLLQLEDYQGVIDMYTHINKSLNDFHIERNMAKAVSLKGNCEEAISILNKAVIRFGKQFYIYSDIGEIYELIEDKEQALKNYYKACLLVHDDKFLLSTLIKISKLLINQDRIVARKHLDLCILLRQRENWKLKSEEKNLLQELSDCQQNNDINILKKELRSIWSDLANKDIVRCRGIIERILDSGNGFIRYDDGKKVFFRRNKKYNLKKDDEVIFTIEESYDRKKETYSQAATNLILLKK